MIKRKIIKFIRSPEKSCFVFILNHKIRDKIAKKIDKIIENNAKGFDSLHFVKVPIFPPTAARQTTINDKLV